MQRRMTRTRRLCLWILDLLFPNRCGCCGAFIPWDGLLCAACEKQLVPVMVCTVCGRNPCVCAAALPHHGAVAGYAYAGTARDGILILKDGKNGNFAEWLGLCLAERLTARQTELTADCIVPVPMSPQGLRERGYNQAALIARAVSCQTGIPVREDCLRRTDAGAVQHHLRAAERAENVQRYQSGGQKLSGCRILLCDDVMTTGATMCRCAELLLAQGAASVAVLAGTITERGAQDGHRN